MSAGFGIQPYGTSGFGADASMTVVHAFAVSTHEVVVELSKAPLDVSGFLVGDVSNPGSWAISVPVSGQVLDVAGVAPYQRPTQWLVRVLQRFPDSTWTVRATCAAKDAAGNGIAAPRFGDFAGVTELAISTPQHVASTKARGGRDLKNAPAPRVDDTNIGGVLVIDGGDYALVDGPSLTKKLMARRLTTTPGEFFHIPNYGVGLSVKQPLPGGDLQRLKGRIEKQMLLEPDVQSVRVALTQSSNQLTCVVSATISPTGQNVTVGMDSQIGQP